MTWILSHRYNRYYEENNQHTMQKHLIELKKNGFVWWGVGQQSYSRAPLSYENLELLKNQMKNNIETNVFFIENVSNIEKGTREAYKGTLSQIESFDKEKSHTEAPPFYNKLEHRLWLKLSKIEPVELNRINRLIHEVDVSPQTALRVLLMEDYY